MKMLPPVSTRVAATPRTSGKVPAKKQVANPGVEFDTALASARAKPQAQSQDARRTQGFESTKRRSGDAKEAQPGRADAVAAEVPAALPQAKSTAPERAASDDSEKNETNIQPEGKQDDAATIQEQCAAVSQGVSPSAQAGGAEDAVDEEAQKLARQDAGVGEVPQRPVVALVRRGDGEQKPQKDAEDVQPAADGSEPEQGGEAPTKGARGKRGGKENAGEGQVQLPPERKEAVVKPVVKSEDTEADMQDVEKEAPRVFEAPVKKPRTVEAAKEWGGAEAKVEAQQAAAVVPQAAKDVEPAAAKLPETEGAER
ncbi:MAG TPA: hypothetical protein VHM90_08440, partial [Phycisphaerae bacterium]|nr:hypothetical protein [Phycisphaerae bacterium]